MEADKEGEAKFIQAGNLVLQSLVNWCAVAVARRNEHALMMMQANIGNLFQAIERACREVERADGIEFPEDKVTVQ